jgi:hypothetical protein
MEPVRVIGRIDLAEPVHAALRAAGVDARLATAAPMTVVSTTGRDGSVMDVIAQDLATCAAIKKVQPTRPVVVVTPAETSDLVALAAEGARGPDAHVVWPASGEDLVAACDRARASATVRRPRFPRRVIAGGLVGCAALAAVAGAIAWSALHGRPIGPLVLSAARIVLGVPMLGLAAREWKRAPMTRDPRWQRVYSLGLLLWAADLLVPVAFSVVPS